MKQKTLRKDNSFNDLKKKNNSCKMTVVQFVRA